MTERTIKFSHSYNKMPYEDWVPNTRLEATLLEVFVAEKKDLSEGFIEYDTSYFVRDYSTSETFLKKQNYPLPNGKLLVLLLQTSNSSGLHLWTTVRRHTPAKEEYYRKLRGEKLTIQQGGWHESKPELHTCPVCHEGDWHWIRLTKNTIACPHCGVVIYGGKE